MKSKILLYLLLITLAFPTQAQLTITQENFPRPTQFVDSVSFMVVQTTLAVPSEGENQFWDYSNLDRLDYIVTDYKDVTNNTIFPTALSRREESSIFSFFLLRPQTYEVVDENGWYDVGALTRDTTYAEDLIIDTLRLLANESIQEGQINKLEFPVTYGNQWTGAQTTSFHLELDEASMEYEKLPLLWKQKVTQTREVVGHGQLVIPTEDNSPSEPTEVLLVKIVEVLTDSLFENGEPASSELLDFLFVQQNPGFSLIKYEFYAPDIGVSLLEITAFGETAVNARYRTFFRDFMTSVEAPELLAANYFPNPIVPGQTLNIQLNENHLLSHFYLTDLTGRQVFVADMENNNGDALQIKMPNSLKSGMYVYHIQNQEGRTINTGKVLVH